MLKKKTLRECKKCGILFRMRRDALLLCRVHYRELKRAWHKENPEMSKRIAVAYRIKNLEKRRKQNREWYHENVSRAKRTMRKWRKFNREKIDKDRVSWLKKNPIKAKAYDFRRTYKGSLTSSELLELVKNQPKCNGCGIDFIGRNFNIDHFVPRSKGGASDIKNLQLLCGPCNISKWDFSWNDFLAHAKKIVEWQARI